MRPEDRTSWQDICPDANGDAFHFDALSVTIRERVPSKWLQISISKFSQPLFFRPTTFLFTWISEWTIQSHELSHELTNSQIIQKAKDLSHFVYDSSHFLTRLPIYKPLCSEPAKPAVRELSCSAAAKPSNGRRISNSRVNLMSHDLQVITRESSLMSHGRDDSPWRESWLESSN